MLVVGCWLLVGCSSVFGVAQDKPVQEPQTPKGTVLFEKNDDGSDAAVKAHESGDKKAEGEITPAVSDVERSGAHVFGV